MINICTSSKHSVTKHAAKLSNVVYPGIRHSKSCERMFVQSCKFNENNMEI